MLTQSALGSMRSEICLTLASEYDLDALLLAGRYTLLDRSAETQLLDVCRKRDIGLVIGGRVSTLAFWQQAPLKAPVMITNLQHRKSARRSMHWKLFARTMASSWPPLPCSLRSIQIWLLRFWLAQGAHHRCSVLLMASRSPFPMRFGANVTKSQGVDP